MTIKIVLQRLGLVLEPAQEVSTKHQPQQDAEHAEGLTSVAIIE
jgi:hypothetical protein